MPFDGGFDEKLDRAPDLGRIPTDLLAHLVEGCADPGPRRRVAMAWHIPLIGMTRDDPQHLGPLSTDDDRWMRPLKWLGLAHRVAHGVETAFIGDRSFC